MEMDASPHSQVCDWECGGMGVTWLSWPQQAAWFPFAAALIQITQQSPCFAMIKRYSPHGKMCYSKLSVAPVANLIYTMGNRKAFFIWLNSRLWHEISFLKSTCWKCYDNKNAFFFPLVVKAEKLTDASSFHVLLPERSLTFFEFNHQMWYPGCT